MIPGGIFFSFVLLRSVRIPGSGVGLTSTGKKEREISSVKNLGIGFGGGFIACGCRKRLTNLSSRKLFVEVTPQSRVQSCFFGVSEHDIFFRPHPIDEARQSLIINFPKTPPVL